MIIDKFINKYNILGENDDLVFLAILPFYSITLVFLLILDVILCPFELLILIKHEIEKR